MERMRNLLAHDIKKETLYDQRYFIINQLFAATQVINASPTYIYIGQIYPENKKYFKKCGYKIKTLKSKRFLAQNRGQILNIFFVKKNIKLSPIEEIRASKNSENRRILEREIDGTSIFDLYG